MRNVTLWYPCFTLITPGSELTRILLGLTQTDIFDQFPDQPDRQKQDRTPGPGVLSTWFLTGKLNLVDVLRSLFVLYENGPSQASISVSKDACRKLKQRSFFEPPANPNVAFFSPTNYFGAIRGLFVTFLYLTISREKIKVVLNQEWCGLYTSLFWFNQPFILCS